MTRRWQIGIIVLVLTALVAGAEAQEQRDKTAESLAGSWRAVEGARDGQALTKDELAPFKMLLGEKGGRLGGQDQFAGGGRLHNLGIQFDRTTSPQRLYLLRSIGLRYTTYPGIFRLDGERLIVCLNLEPWTSPDGPAMRPVPKEFAAAKGSGLTLLTFEKAKP